MDIGVPLRELGGIDSLALREVILGIDDGVWLENSYRQNAYDVHTQTHSLVMLFTTPREQSLERSDREGDYWQRKLTPRKK